MVSVSQPNQLSSKMEKVEEDMIRSKSLRQNQAKEFSQQLKSLRQKYEQQVCISLYDTSHAPNMPIYLYLNSLLTSVLPMYPGGRTVILSLISEHLARWSQGDWHPFGIVLLFLPICSAWLISHDKRHALD